MGRRKKEPPSAHREHIAAAAAQLFQTCGIDLTTMDDIAQAAGYSKATLYVYFSSKQEIINLLALQIMQKMHGCIAEALAQPNSCHKRYNLICQNLVQYQNDYPFFFQMLMLKINEITAGRDCLPEEKDTYETGEAINSLLRDYLLEGIAQGELRPDLEPLPTIFSLWGMLGGLIQLAANKEEYIVQAMGLPKEQFLAYGFQLLYNSIAKKED